MKALHVLFLLRKEPLPTVSGWLTPLLPSGLCPVVSLQEGFPDCLI